jgi:hypothetical protein
MKTSIYLVLALCAVCATIVSAAEQKNHPVQADCPLPNQDNVDLFWIRAAREDALGMVRALGYSSRTDIIKQFVSTSDSWNRGSPPSKFQALSCSQSQSVHKLQLVEDGMTRIRSQPNIPSDMTAAIQLVSSLFSSLQTVIQSAPESTRESLTSTMTEKFNAISQNNVVYDAGRTIVSYLTSDFMSGQLAQNVFSDMMVFYVDSKKNVAAFVEAVSMAANLLQYAATFSKTTSFQQQAQELESLLDKVTDYVENSNTQVIIPNVIRDVAHALLDDQKGFVNAGMKIRTASGGFTFSSTITSYQTILSADPACVDSGRAKAVGSNAAVRFTRMPSTDPDFRYGQLKFEISFDNRKTYVSAGMGEVVWKDPKGNVVEKKNNWVVGKQSWKLLWAKLQLPMDPVPPSFKPDHYYMSEYVNSNGALFVCSELNLDYCDDPLRSERPNHSDAAANINCWFDIDFER